MAGVTHNARNHVPNSIRNSMPDGWKDGLCPECECFASWTVQSDLFAPAHGKVECRFCDSEEYFDITDD